MTIPSPSFEGLRVAALESRRQEDLHRLIERFGGLPFVSPSMREVPIEQNREAVDFANRILAGEINFVIFTTGVGFKHLLKAIEKHIPVQRFLTRSRISRPSPEAPSQWLPMREVGLTPTHRIPEPNTWREVLQYIDQGVPIANQSLACKNTVSRTFRSSRGLKREEPTLFNVAFISGNSEDTKPLENNIHAIVAGQRDCLLFTSAHQAVNLMRLARDCGVEERCDRL